MTYTNETLERDFKSGQLAQSYLLFSQDIVLLNEIAKNYAKNFNVADVFWLTAKEGAKNITVDQVLAFNENVHLASIGPKKLLIISDFSMMTIQSQNKMLKSLEDTRTDIVFLLLASNQDKVVNTIKSRCVILYQPELKGGSLLEQALFTSNKNTKQIFQAAKDLFACKTLEEALPYLGILTAKDNFQVALIALTKQASLQNLREKRSYDILRVLSEISMRVDANCNSANALDLLVLELFPKR